MIAKRQVYCLILIPLLFSACAGTGNAPIATPTLQPQPAITAHPLATPYSQLPAVGICASFEGEMVTVTINADIPDPRCAKVNAEQKLEVVNNTQNDLAVTLGSFTLDLVPGDRKSFDLPFGQFLQPGVHQLTVMPCCGAEIWLEAK